MLHTVSHWRCACCVHALRLTFLRSHKTHLSPEMVKAMARHSPSLHSSTWIILCTRPGMMHLLGRDFLGDFQTKVSTNQPRAVWFPPFGGMGEAATVNPTACQSTSAACPRPGCWTWPACRHKADRQRQSDAVVQDRHSLLSPVGNGARGPVDGIVGQLRPHVSVRLHACVCREWGVVAA